MTATQMQIGGRYVNASGVPTNGATVYAYRATRVPVPAAGTTFASNIAPSDGLGPDAGPVTTGTAYGAAGNWVMTVPTREAYVVSVNDGGTVTWFYVASGSQPSLNN